GLPLVERLRGHREAPRSPALRNGLPVAAARGQQCRRSRVGVATEPADPLQHPPARHSRHPQGARRWEAGHRRDGRRLEASAGGCVVAAKTSTAIELPPLALETVEIPLIGTSPLIVHASSEKALRAMADKQQKKATKGREAKVPFEDFVGSLYWLSEKPAKPTEEDVDAARFGLPSIAFKSAAVT